MGEAIDILSREEALALPPRERPLNFRVTSAIYHKVWEAVGSASMCWEPKPGNQVFDTATAERVALDLLFTIADELDRLGVTVEQINPAPANTTNPMTKTMHSKTVVIYHKSDFDGLFCREIARKFLPDAELIGWEYGEPEPAVSPDAQLYIMDLSVPGLMSHPRLIWIDHHKTAIDKYPSNIRGYRIDGVGACRLAWQWFITLQNNAQNATNEAMQIPLPGKQHFIDRRLWEPEAVRLAGEYDIWDKRDPDADVLQFGLRSEELTAETWQWLLTVREPDRQSEYDLGMTNVTLMRLLQAGRLLQRYQEGRDKSVIEKNGFTLAFEGRTFLAANASHYNSHLFTAGIRPEHEALLGFCWRGDKWTVSLYGVPHRPDVDLSPIAVKHGGGGHRQACGFTATSLPWIQCDHKFIDSQCCLKCGWYPPQGAH